MAMLPRSSIPSVAKFMTGLQVEDKTEKGLMVRIGTLIDAIIAAQRGSNNAGSNLDKKAQADNLSTPSELTGTTENIFNGIGVSLDPIPQSSNLSNYEVQVDSDPNFSDPTIKSIFNTDTTFKGLTSETDYNIRARALTKDGIAGPWSVLDPVATGSAPSANTSEVDGGEVGTQVIAGPFTFTNDAEDVFAMSNFGQVFFDFAEGGSAFNFYLKLYMDDVLQETLTLVGPDLADAPIVYDTSSLSLLRHWPLALFDLIEPGDSPSNHTFKVVTQDGEITDEATAFVKF